MRIAVRPRWIVFSVLVVFVAVACVFLGFWQLSRLEERRASNAVLVARLAREPIPLEDLRAALGPEQGIEVDPADYEYTMVTTAGRLTDRGRVLVRSQVVRGQAGVHGVYAMELDDGTAVLVNVGWFPLDLAIGSIADAFGGSDEVELTGLVRADQKRPALGRTEAPGLLDTVARIDIDRIQSSHRCCRSGSNWSNHTSRGACPSPSRYPKPVKDPTCPTPCSGSRSVPWPSSATRP